jgi:chromosome partitioning protein
MDPQASLTKFMGLMPGQLNKTVADAIIDEQPLPIHTGIHGMDLVPTNRLLSGTEMQLVSAAMRDLRLKEAIEPVQDNYDFILVDCPPSLGLLSYISLVAATHVLVPIETHLKAFEGTDELLQTLTHVKNKANRKLQIIGFVPTRYAKANSADARALSAINEQLSSWGKIFPPIPRATAFVDASEERAPLAVYDSKHAAVSLLEEIAQSLESVE